jgi:hypothetical protein
MAKVSSSFSMQVPPEKAQELFLRDIAPELGRDGSFYLYHQDAEVLAFSDGVVDPPEGFDEDEDIAGEPAADAGVLEEGSYRLGLGARRGPFPVESEELGVSDGSTPAVLRREPRFYGGLRRLFSRRIKVRFELAADGTHVTISGSADKTVARGLDKLGQQGHWPEIADRPHD